MFNRDFLTQPEPADLGHHIGKSFVDGTRTYTVLHWSIRRPRSLQVRVEDTARPGGVPVIGYMSAKDVLAMQATA